MAKLSIAAEKLVDLALARYNVPAWAKPYIYKYAARNKLDTIKLAIGLITTGRRKGKITKEEVTLPNGMCFKMSAIIKLLNLFFHGAQNIAKLEEYWASSYKIGNPEYEMRFSELAVLDQRRARAVKNLIEGLKHNVQEEPQSIKLLFKRLRAIDDWHERVFASGVILNYSFMKTFGGLFLKAFYPTVPEFMRAFGKAFTLKERPERWDLLEARSLMRLGKLDNDHILSLSRDLLSYIQNAIDENIKLARELKIEEEILLLKEVAIAYPIHTLKEMGVRLNPETEIELMLKSKRKTKGQ